MVLHPTTEAAPFVRLEAARDAATFGAKAASQAALAAEGLPVPAGVVITDRFRREFLTATGLDEHDAAGIRGTALPESLQGALLDACRHLEGTLIVRSSGLGEDSADASFAGMLESIADVEGAHHLELALRQCWAARAAERVRAYEERRGRPLGGLAVLVQRQIHAHFAGVLFTCDPSEPAAKRTLVEYVRGPGEDLVSGRVTPGRLSLDGAGVITELQRLEGDVDPGPLLDARDKLARLAAQARRTGGSEQDVEWVLDEDGELHVVQSRPITAVACTRPKVAWTNANVDENFPTPITPLQYSVAATGYTHYFRGLARIIGVSERALAALEPRLERLVGAHEGRLYYQLTNLHAVMRAAPGGAFLTSSFNAFTGAEGFPEAERVAPEGRLRSALRLCGTAVRMTRAWLRLERGVERFEARVDAYARSTSREVLAELDRVDLGARVESFTHIRRHQWTDAGLADASAMITHGLLLKVLSPVSGDPRAAAGEVLQGLDVVSAAPAAGLWELARLVRAAPDDELETLLRSGDDAVALAAIRERPRHATFRAAFEAWLEDHGHRCSGELVFTVPSYQEEPSRVLSLLRAYLDAEGPAPNKVAAKRAEERLRAIKRLTGELGGWRGLVLGPIARACARSVTMRERARGKQALLYRRLRDVALALGAAMVREGLMEHADDAVYFSLEELCELASGSALQPASAARVAAVRRAEHTRQAAVRPPSAFSLPEGEVWIGNEEETGDTSRLDGAGACAGVITGRAVVLTDLADAGEVAPGDILVTRQTDPGWAPLFPLISGLVVERGGLLSHGAILAREYGLPTVVGVPGVTGALETGQKIRVDGGRGHVRIVDE